MSEHFHAVMDRSIFKLDLPVETTSAYILIASLLEQSVRPTLEEIRQRWTRSNEDLDEALSQLIHLRIVNPQNAADGTPLYYTNPSSVWRRPGSGA